MKRRQLLQSALAFGTLPSVALTSPADMADKPQADMSTDVVIVGGGFAGLTAAVMASRAGAKVVVLEKRSYCGGDGVLSAGIIASAYSEVHKAQGFKGKADLDSYWQLIEEGHTDEPLSKVRDNMPNSPMYSGIDKHDPNVLRRSAEMSPAVAAFVMSYGIDFLPINPQQPFLLPSKPGSMPKFAQAMLDELQKRGVSVLLDSAVTGLETQTEDKGQNRVTGVRFVRDGKTQFIRARSVVLATGGFSDNRQMMRRYKRVWANIPKGFTAIGEGVPPGHDGDGITLGRLVGGAIEDMESMPKLFAAPKPGDRSPSWILFDTDTAYLVDKFGRRFCNEHESRYAGCALACFRQNIDGAYVVLDEATVTGPNRERWRYSDLLTAKALFKGQTIEEAATKAGVDPKGLQRTLQRIADDAAAGKGDTEFGRKDKLFRALKGPFYVSTPSWPVRFKTEGGLEVNPDFQVLRAADDTQIPGLYAIGATCGSISTRLCDVIASGLIVGPIAAAGA